MIENLISSSASLGGLARNFLIGGIVAVVIFMGYLVMKKRYNVDLVEMLKPKGSQALKQTWTAGLEEGIRKAQVGTGLEVKVVEASQDHVTMTLGQELVIVVRRLPPEKT